MNHDRQKTLISLPDDVFVFADLCGSARRLLGPDRPREAQCTQVVALITNEPFLST